MQVGINKTFRIGFLLNWDGLGSGIFNPGIGR